MLTKQDWFIIGTGLPIGLIAGFALIAGFSGILGTATYADEQSQRSHESEQELLQAQAKQGARREQLERSSSPTAEELAMNEARLILSRPHTLREAEIALQVLNGRPPPYQSTDPSGGQYGYSDYGRPSYTGSAASTGMATTSQNGSSSRYRGALDQPSASRAWLERQQRASTQAYGPETADSDGSTINNTGAINVRTGQHYAPAGPTGYVNPQDGTYYAQSGPNGVVNTRTGEYIPTTP